MDAGKAGQIEDMLKRGSCERGCKTVAGISKIPQFTFESYYAILS